MSRNLLGIVNIFLLLLVGIIVGVYVDVTPDAPKPLPPTEITSLHKALTVGWSGEKHDIEFLLGCLDAAFLPLDKQPYAPLLPIDNGIEYSHYEVYCWARQNDG